MRQVLAAVAMVTLVACGARSTPRPATAGTATTATTEAPSTTASSTTSTTAPPPRSTDGIQPGMSDAITACEPAMKGATLDVVAVNGPYAAAILHKGSTVSHRSLTFANSRWYDGNHGQAACAPEIYEMPGAYPPAPRWDIGGFAAYFDAGSSRQGSSQDGTAGRDATTLVVAMSGNHADKGSIGGGYWVVLTIDRPDPEVYCAYGANGRLTHELPHAAYSYASGPAGPPNASVQTTPPSTPEHCPATAPAV